MDIGNNKEIGLGGEKVEPGGGGEREKKQKPL